MENKDTKYAKWLNGELSQEELEELRSSGELEELEAIVKVADDMVLPKYDWEGGYEKFKSGRPEKTAKVVSFPMRWALAAAASVALLVTAYFLLGDGSTQVSAEQMATVSHDFIDGSSVVLNDGSDIVFDKDNWAEKRLVNLKGEAYFQVEKGAPFIVETPNGTVEVLGTQFNVRAWGGKLYVECYEGRVQVKSGGEDVILTQSESVNWVGGKMEAKQIISNTKPLWTSGSSRFHKEKANSVLAELERQYGMKIKAPQVSESFSGVLPHDDLDEALNIFCKSVGLEYSISSDGKSAVVSARD